MFKSLNKFCQILGHRIHIFHQKIKIQTNSVVTRTLVNKLKSYEDECNCQTVGKKSVKLKAKKVYARVNANELI